MANEEHLRILKQGVEVWNQWRGADHSIGALIRVIDLSGADLHGADLGHANLSRVDFSEADLGGADLIKAELSEANFREANLSKAYLGYAHLHRTNLHGANLREVKLVEAIFYAANLDEADLSQTDLTGAILRGVNLSGADLNEATVGWTSFGDTDLSTVKGLDTVVHAGPSDISISTLTRSKGKISETFLRGAGVPDAFITYIASLVGQPIQYYSCFISYSHKDETFAERLYADLQNKGVRCWFAPEDMKIGDKIRPTIDRSIRVHDKLLLILSEHSIDSDWVEKEVETAFEEERRRDQTVLFPVRLDETVMETDQAWAADIRRTRHIGDFNRWKDHDAYQQAFERLLRALKAEDLGESLS